MPVFVRLILPLLVGLAAAGCDRQKANGEQAPPALAPVKGVDRSHRGEAAPTASFGDPDAGETSLAGFRGAPLLVNLWASWCAPCVRELPTLERLAAERDGALQVIAVSQDMAPRSSVDAFLANRGIERFAAYHDPDMTLTAALGVQVMPTSVLYDSAGKEVWRFTGDLDWTGSEAGKLLAEALSPATAR